MTKTASKPSALFLQMRDSLTRQLNAGFAIYGTRHQAIEYAREHSCAGEAVWDSVLATWRAGK